ncbi:MAG: hypothetical protein WC586_01050 [Methanoregula sp.]
MAGIPDNSTVWHRTTILVRADILDKARAGGIDINDTCNRALADLLHVDLRQQPLGTLPDTVPVMVAPENVPVLPVTLAQDTETVLHPVINANDPAAVRNMLQSKKKKPVPASKAPPVEPQKKDPVVKPVPEKKAVPVPEVTAKSQKPSAGKRGKDDAIKKFIGEKIVRGEPDNATIPKDEMYSLFTRWCNAMRVSPVPERRRFTLTLKNHFALTEKIENGVPCWMNVRIK